jgi:hypothetical protein
MLLLNLTNKPYSPGAVAVGAILADLLMILMMSVPLIAIVAVLYGILERANNGRKSLAAGLEAQLLELAHEKGGTLTIPEISMNTNLSLEESELVLDSLVKRNFINLRVTNNGAVLYDFPRIAN